MPTESRSQLTRTRLVAELRAIRALVDRLLAEAASSTGGSPAPRPSRSSSSPRPSRPSSSPQPPRSRRGFSGRRAPVPASALGAVSRTSWPTPCSHCVPYCNPHCPCSCHHKAVHP